MRRYDDPVETRMGLVSGMEGPEQFLWRGRLWKVRAVVAHWVETGEWWRLAPDSADGGQPTVDLLREREWWRVEAGRPGRQGVFELFFDWSAGAWRLAGCVD